MVDRWQVHEGDVLDVLRTLPDDHVHTVVTSPPYWGLRDYQGEEQVGLEETYLEYITTLVTIFAEISRVLHPTGTLWLNIADSYATGAGKTGGNAGGGEEGANWGRRGPPSQPNRMPQPGLKAKDLSLVPERLAIALQADGWWIRNRVTWVKTNPKPSSVKDRLTPSTEAIWFCAINHHYHFDAYAGREPAKTSKPSGNLERTPNQSAVPGYNMPGGFPYTPARTRHPRDVWRFPTGPNIPGHPATFPEELPLRCIRMGTSAAGCCPECGAPLERVVEKVAHGRKRTDGSPRRLPGMDRVNREAWQEEVEYVHKGWNQSCDHDIPEPVPCRVLDPFTGSGTTGKVAKDLDRDFVGIDLNPEYVALAQARIGIPVTQPEHLRDDHQLGLDEVI